MFGKRLFDILVTLPLITFLLPVFLIISFLLWKSGGPIFFRQDRVGYKGKIFRIIKFRTMTPETKGQSNILVTSAADSRITPLGRILRRYKLDELPQLLNILLGDMSLVGPRPEVPKYVSLYPEDIRNKILSFLPGITDMSSLYFFDEEIKLKDAKNVEESYIQEILPLKLKLAVEYVENSNLILDIKLLAKTFLRFFRSN